MFGAIIGDIIGSRWEFKRIKTKEFLLFSNFIIPTLLSIRT